jgi:hypothetical protein
MTHLLVSGAWYPTSPATSPASQRATDDVHVEG